MYQDWSKHKVLEVFFKEPTKKHQLREISRTASLGEPSVKRYLEELIEEGLIQRVEEGVYPGYRASMNSKFKNYKKTDTIRKIEDTGLLEKLESSFYPTATVLFGSAAHGEDTEESDIDILIVAGGKKIDLTQYEKEFNRPINLKFTSEKQILNQNEFTNSLANGVVLQGFLKVK